MGAPLFIFGTDTWCAAHGDTHEWMFISMQKIQIRENPCPGSPGVRSVVKLIKSGIHIICIAESNLMKKKRILLSEFRSGKD